MTMNSRITTALASVAVLLTLTGCAASAAPTTTSEPTPTPTAEPNAAACERFSEVTIEVGEDATGSDPGADLADIAVRFDEVALEAEGEVRDRIDAVIDALPEPPHMITFLDNRKTYSDTLMAVARACDAEGHSIQVATLVPANQ